MTPTPDTKGAQTEQYDKAAAEVVLALEAEYEAGRRSRDVDVARTERALADECKNSHRLATALSECREALKTTQHWLEQQDFEEALNVVDAALALAAQPPRSGEEGACLHPWSRTS